MFYNIYYLWLPINNFVNKGEWRSQLCIYAEHHQPPSFIFNYMLDKWHSILFTTIMAQLLPLILVISFCWTSFLVFLSYLLLRKTFQSFEDSMTSWILAAIIAALGHLHVLWWSARLSWWPFPSKTISLGVNLHAYPRCKLPYVLQTHLHPFKSSLSSVQLFWLYLARRRPHRTPHLYT